MLIQHIAGSTCARLIQRTFGFGASKTCAIGIGLLRGLIPRGALLESLEIYDVPHAPAPNYLNG